MVNTKGWFFFGDGARRRGVAQKGDEGRAGVAYGGMCCTWEGVT